MRLSADGYKLLEKLEGLRLDPYRDAAGIWTIGIGCTRWFDGKPVKPQYKLVSREQAMELLDLQLPAYETVVMKRVRNGVTQQEFDAATSFCFNIGRYAFITSTFGRRWQKGDCKGAAEAMQWYAKITIKPGGVFPAGSTAYRETPVLGPTNKKLVIEPGEDLSGYIALHKTKCWLYGLQRRRRIESRYFLAGCIGDGKEIEQEPPKMTEQKPAYNTRADTSHEVRYEDLEKFTEEELQQVMGLEISLVASCGHKRAIGAMAEAVGTFIYPEIADDNPDLPPPEKYQLTVTLDNDYPELAGTTITKVEKITSNTQLGIVQAQYRAAQGVVAKIETLLRNAGRSLA